MSQQNPNQKALEQVRALLETHPDPVSLQNLMDVVDLQSVSVDGGTLSVKLVFGYAIDAVRETLQAELAQWLSTLGYESLSLTLDWEIKPAMDKLLEGVGKVKNIIAVASGKGGVGKSTTAVNLALALSAEGANVGIIDADIYGPSLSLMLGVPKDTRPEVHQQSFFLPIEAQGLQSISMGYLATEETPMVWRGPMASGALQQLLKQTIWNSLDYLVVDMPPGTGDIQLTLSQQVPVSGAVVVTTPQDIALLDAKKGVEMFRKVHVPVLGIVENMAMHVCSNCGHQEAIFGEGGGERIASEYGVSVLGRLPLDRSIREHADSGNPSVVADPDGAIAQAYHGIARLVGGQLAKMARQASSKAPKISIHQD